MREFFLRNKISARKVVKFIFIFLVTVFVLLASSFFREFQQVRREQLLRGAQEPLAAIHSRSPLSARDASLIESWMTFDYVSRIFRLPPDYLAKSLGVADPQYPRISIGRYAKRRGMSVGEFTSKVRSAVAAFFENSPAPQ